MLKDEWWPKNPRLAEKRDAESDQIHMESHGKIKDTLREKRKEKRIGK